MSVSAKKWFLSDLRLWKDLNLYFPLLTELNLENLKLKQYNVRNSLPSAVEDGIDSKEIS